MKLVGNISTLIGLILFIYSIIPLVKGLRNIKVSDIRNKLLKRAKRVFASSLVLSTFGIGVTPAENTAQLVELAEGLISGKYFGSESTVAVGEENQYQAMESKQQEGLNPNPSQAFNTPNEAVHAPEDNKHVAAQSISPAEEKVPPSYRPSEASTSEIPSQREFPSESAAETVPSAVPETEPKALPDSEPTPESLPADPINAYVDADGNGLIKGSSWGIYHLPGSPNYERTIYPVAWFKSVEEAESAGYSAPQE